MKIEFTDIKIENFKSISKLETNFGNRTFIYGANETGKTSFADAISWCLTGKNSLGDSQFNFVPIGTIDVSPSVTLEIDISGKTKNMVDHIILQRVYQAKQNRNKEFTGEYQTFCYVNRMKVNVREFDNWVETHICDSEIFRLIHDVRYFTENIATNGRERPWEAQRRLLFIVSGIKPDLVFASSKKRFEPILEGLQRYDNASQYLEFLKSEEKRLVDEIKYYNSRIELARSMLENFETDNKDIEQEIESLNKKVNDIDIQLEEDTNRLREEKDKKVSELQKLYNDKANDFKKSQEEYSKKAEQLNRKRKQLSEKNVDTHCAISSARIQLNRVKDDYANISIQCPTCGQYIPTDMIEEKKKELENRIIELQESVDKIAIEGKNIEKELAEVEEQISELKAPVYPDELREIQQELVNVDTMESTEEGRAIIQKRKELLANLDDLIGKKQAIERDKKTKEKIFSMETKVSELLDSRANNSRMMDLVKDFIDAKCKYAEKKVNSLADGIEFKLFRENKTNGELRDCCDIYFHGVPYSSLSYSTKFIVSMNIAFAFQKFYNIQFPVLVDNAESIDFSEEIFTQSILLIKREEYCKCGYMGKTSRKEKDGLWTCKKCGNRFKKTLEIVTEQ